MKQIKSKYPLSDERTRVLLVQPPLPANKRHKRVIPVGIASIAAYVSRELPEVNVAILDAHVLDLSYPEIIAAISSTTWDIVGISYWTVQAGIAANISKGIRSCLPDTLIVHGGVHATVAPEEALETSDIAVMHEGEVSFLEILRESQGGGNYGSVKGIAVKKDDDIHITEKRPFIKNLDSIPFPKLDLLHVDLYDTHLHIVGGSRMPLIGSRGCPFNCSYCSSPVMWQGKVRYRSPENIVMEIESIIEKHGITQFHFWDDNFTLKPKHVEEFCNLIIGKKLDVRWVCLDRTELINKNKKLLPLMREAGCIGIEIGLESANPDTFIHIQKNQSFEEGKKAATNLKESGIAPLYTCMAFNPGESIMGYYLQKEYLDNIQEGLEWYNFFHPFPFPLYIGQFATAYPGTSFYKKIKKLSEELIEKPEDRFHHQINSVPKSLLADIPVRTVDQLEAWHYILFIYAIEVGFYMDYDRRNNFGEMASKHFTVWRFIYPFFRRCDGRMTVKEIACELSEYLNISYVSSMRMTCFAVYIFAQLGMIRSGLYYLDYPVTYKTLQIPKERFFQTYLWLSKYGISPENIVEKAEL